MQKLHNSEIAIWG